MKWTFATYIFIIKNMKTPLKSIILMGIKHCGKSTQGKRIAERLGVDFYDTDDLIEQQAGKTVREIYTQNGKDAFMKEEALACRKLSETLNGKICVIATGGGICDNVEAVEILKSLGTIVFLQADEALACDRIVREAAFESTDNPEVFNISNLPAYIAKEKPHSETEVRSIFHNFYEARTKAYSGIANAVIKMQDATKEQNTRTICALLGI